MPRPHGRLLSHYGSLVGLLVIFLILVLFAFPIWAIIKINGSREQIDILRNKVQELETELRRRSFQAATAVATPPTATVVPDPEARPDQDASASVAHRSRRANTAGEPPLITPPPVFATRRSRLRSALLPALRPSRRIRAQSPDGQLGAVHGRQIVHVARRFRAVSRAVFF